jgi:hypothetical protein
VVIQLVSSITVMADTSAISSQVTMLQWPAGTPQRGGGWLAGRLAGWPAGWLAGWLAGWPAQLSPQQARGEARGEARGRVSFGDYVIGGAKGAASSAKTLQNFMTEISSSF